MENLDVKVDDRNTGKFHHKNAGIKCVLTKAQAMKDITLDCGEGKFFTQNYINRESIVLASCKCSMQFIQINTTIL